MKPPQQAESHTLLISGMTCANCVAHIQKALLATPGVTAAVVNLATETAQVRGAPGLSRATLVEAIEGTGYKVREDTPSGDAPRAEKASRWQLWRR